MMTAFFSPLPVVGVSAARLRSFRRPGKLSEANPARPACKNARRPGKPNETGPRQL
jgi:hypothetical protein